jgi:MFS family permease
MLFSAGPALITRACPPERRGEALGLLVTVSTLAMTFGPVVAGLLTDHVGWPAVFLVSIPPALVAFVVVPRLLPPDAPSGTRARFDLAGSATIGLGLGGLLLALNQGAVWGWTSPATLSVAAVSLLTLVLFVLVERRAPDPMLDLSLFREPAFVGSTVGAVAFYVAISGILVLVPLYLVEGRGYELAQAGLMLGAQQIARSVASAVGGRLSDRLGTKLPAVGGLVVMMAGVGLLARLDAASSIVELAVLLGVVGIGAGVYLAPNTSAIMGSVPRERQGLASAIVTTARNVGIATGVVLAGVAVTTGPGASVPPDVLFGGIRIGYLMMLAALAVGAVLAALTD